MLLCMETLVFVLIIGFLTSALAVVPFFVALFSSTGVVTRIRRTSAPEKIYDEYMHSSPCGYFANTAYSETR